MNIFQGDSTASFGSSFMTINLRSDIDPVPTISRAELRIGCLIKKFENPIFPLKVEFTEKETAGFGAKNTAYLAVWDSEGRKRTCYGSATFDVNCRRV